jgi:hypothetical protein
VVFNLQDGTSLALIAHGVSICTENEKVAEVFVSRPLLSLPVRRAKADLVETLTELHIRPDRLMQRDLASWKDYAGKAAIRTPFHGLLLNVDFSTDPGGTWHYLLGFSPVTQELVPIITPATQPSAASIVLHKPISSVFVKLPSALAVVTGTPRHEPSKGMVEIDHLEPQNLTVQLPDGTQLLLMARSSHEFSFDGEIEGVFIRGPINPVPYQQARAQLVEVLQATNLYSKNSTAEAIGHLPIERSDQMGDVQYGFNDSSHGVQTTFRLCPDPVGGWYYFLILRTRDY